MSSRSSRNFTDTICCDPAFVPLPPNIRPPASLELCGLMRDGVKGVIRAIGAFDTKLQTAPVILSGLTARIIRLDCVVTLTRRILEAGLKPSPALHRVQAELVHVAQRSELIISPDDDLVLPGFNRRLFVSKREVAVARYDEALDATDPMFDAPSKITGGQFDRVEARLDDARGAFSDLLASLGYEEEGEVLREFAAEARSRVCERHGAV